jgi:hypothetical protein
LLGSVTLKKGLPMIFNRLSHNNAKEPLNYTKIAS